MKKITHIYRMVDQYINDDGLTLTALSYTSAPDTITKFLGQFPMTLNQKDENGNVVDAQQIMIPVWIDAKTADEAYDKFEKSAKEAAQEFIAKMQMAQQSQLVTNAKMKDLPPLPIK